jgi:hypothetical protein
VVEYTFFVVADSEDEAEEEAQYKTSQDRADYCIASEVTSEKQIDREWRDCIPYGEGVNDETVMQMFEKLKPPAPPYQDPNQSSLPGFPKP